MKILIFILFIFKSGKLYSDVENDNPGDFCLNARKNNRAQRSAPVLVGAGSNTNYDDDGEFERKLVTYFNFEKHKSFIQLNVPDSTPFENNGRFSPGGLVLKIPKSTCNNAAFLDCADISLDGETFQGKPYHGITIAVWIMLLTLPGQHNIFETYGLSHSKGQFHLEVNYGIVRWFHRNEQQRTVFEVAAESVQANKWTHIAATFNTSTGIAQIYIDGHPTNRSVGSGFLSRDWTCLAHIGGSCSSKSIVGFIDEFRIYNYAISMPEVQKLEKMCQFDSFIGIEPSPSLSSDTEAETRSSTNKSLYTGADGTEGISDELYLKRNEILRKQKQKLRKQKRESIRTTRT